MKRQIDYFAASNIRDDKGRLICPRCDCVISKHHTLIANEVVCVDCLNDDELLLELKERYL
jgi:hypothetical protein